MSDVMENRLTTASGGTKTKRRVTKLRPSTVEALSNDELRTLRFDGDASEQFEALVQRFALSRVQLKSFDGEDVTSMDEARFDQLSAAEAEQHNSGMAVVHFLAPRILRLREGAAKRKWRSFLTKFRKDERLS